MSAEPWSGGALGSDAQPVSYSADDLDVYLRRPGAGGGGVYLALLLIVGAALAALPLVTVPVSVRAQGYLRSASDPHSIAAPAPAEVVAVRPRAARRVRAGDTLVVLVRPEIAARARALQSRRLALEGERRDLELLVRAIESRDAAEPRSLRYGYEWRALQSELAVLLEQEGAAVRELDRAAALLARGLTSAAEVSALEARAGQLRSERALLRVRAGARWRNELATVGATLENVAAEAAIVEGELQQLAVVSPVAGTIEEMAAVSPGSYISAGQEIAIISPESEIIAELYLAPRDLGSLAIDAEVRLQLDAYRYSEWGALTGRIIDVSTELLRVDGRPVGRVRVRPSTTAARAPDGATELRRGSSVSARFPVSRRSLWALLRESRGSRGEGIAMGPTAIRTASG